MTTPPLPPADLPEPPYVDAAALLKGFAVAVLTAVGVFLLIVVWSYALTFFTSLFGASRPLVALSNLLLWLVGLLPHLVGGYAAAAFAKREPIRHGLAMGFVLLMFACLFHVMPGAALGWGQLLNMLLAIPIAGLGAHFYRLGVTA